MNYLSSYANQTMQRDTVHVLRVCLSAGVFLWECEIPKVGTGQPSHPCSVFLPKGKIGRSGEVVNKTLQWQTHKSRYGGLGGVNTNGGGVRCCGYSVLRQTSRSRFNTQIHINRANTLTCIPYTENGDSTMQTPKQDVNG